MIEMIHRRMADAVEVRPKQRQIELLAVPYNTPAVALDFGQRYEESIAPDAFKVEKRRPNQVKILRDHEVIRLIGSLTSVHPNRDDGLHVIGKVAPTALGDESLALAENGDLHVSIGFIPDPAFDEWNPDRTAVVRHSCVLWEVSLVPFPAYDGADILAVRHAPEATTSTATPVVIDVTTSSTSATPGPVGTPNLDQVRAWLADGSLTLTVS